MWRDEWEGKANWLIPLLERLHGMNYWDQDGGEYEIPHFKHNVFEILVVFIVGE